MKKELDVNSWDRREHYHFFKEFEEPFFGLTVHVDCTEAYAYCKKKGISFFLFYLYQSLQAVNAVEAFRYRIEEDKVMIYDRIHAAATISRPEGPFAFSYIEHYDDFSDFEQYAKQEIQRVHEGSGLFQAVDVGQRVVHYSIVSGLNFSAIAHARSYSIEDSCPKIAFGKMVERDGKREMPMSIHGHHALMDGWHIAQYVEAFERLMKSGY